MAQTNPIIKSIKSRQEFDQLQTTTLKKLRKVLNHVLRLHKDVQDIEIFASRAKELTHLNSEISQTIQHLSELNQKCILNFLVSASDAFAHE